MSDKIAEQLQQRMVDLAKQVGWWQTNKKELQPVIDQLEILGYTVEISGNSLDCSGAGDKQMLIATFKVMRGFGYEPTRRPSAKDAFYGSFWYLEGRHDNAVWISFSSTVCKRVQVGTEMKEVPVYDIQCSEAGETMTVTDEELSNV